MKSNLKFPAEICEELNPELSIEHVVEPHLLLGVFTDQVPVVVPVPPGAPPLVPVAPGVPHPHQAHPLLLAATSRVDPVETSDGVGVTLQRIGLFLYWPGRNNPRITSSYINYWEYYLLSPAPVRSCPPAESSSSLLSWSR